MIDLHSHILPGLDDGADSWEQSIEMARRAAADGIAAIVCTPHWVPGKYDNGRDVILERLDELRQRLADAAIPLAVHPGSELRLDPSLPNRIAAGNVLTVNDAGVYALIELPEETLPEVLETFLWQLQIEGITPILSHVERNAALRQAPGRLERLVASGILTQITAASLLWEFSREIKECSLRLLQARLVHMVVTDAHGLRMRTPHLSAARQVVADVLGAGEAHRLFVEIPDRVLRGQPVVSGEPAGPTAAAARPFWRRVMAMARGGRLSPGDRIRP